jgi:hypothetical protein
MEQGTGTRNVELGTRNVADGTTEASNASFVVQGSRSARAADDEMIGPIKTVGIYVQDQPVALDFYTNKLGFELRRQLAWRDHLPVADCKSQIAD